MNLYIAFVAGSVKSERLETSKNDQKVCSFLVNKSTKFSDSKPVTVPVFSSSSLRRYKRLTSSSLNRLYRIPMGTCMMLSTLRDQTTA